MKLRARWTVIVLAVAAACSTSGGAGDAGSSDTGSAAAASSAPATTPTDVVGTHGEPARYEPATCPMDVPPEVTVKVDCGYLSVPENRLDPKTRTIKLAVARLHSRSADPRADPVVRLEGGPGFPSLENVVGYSKSKILDDRDYILWDQRGLGFSTPNLDCAETNEAIWQIFSTSDAPEAEGRVIDDSLARCKARVQAQGVDLDGYTTIQNAADLNDLRIGLGIREWNLQGGSYGSALAIEAVRNHPEGIRSVLLDSVVPPDEPFGAVGRGESALRAFGELYEECAAQPACTAKYGDLHALFDKAAAALDADPYRTTIPDPSTGQPRPIAITGQDLWAGLFNAMYDKNLIPALPAAAQAIVDGNRGIIDQFAADGIPFAAGQYEAMTASVDCADRQRLLEPDALKPFLADHPELGSLLYVSTEETGCPKWGVKEVPASFNTLLGKDTKVPILVMAGRFDPITPPAGTKAVADALGTPLLLFPNSGHGAAGSSDCARGIWFAFMDDPATSPDTACMADLGPPQLT